MVQRARRCLLECDGERVGDVVCVHDVPPVLARSDHREAARLAQAADELLLVPSAGTVDVTGADHDRREPGLAQQPLALLLRAPVGRLHRQLGVLGEQRAVRVAGHDGRGEEESRRVGLPACLEEAGGPVHVDLAERRSGYRICQWAVRDASEIIPLPRERPPEAPQEP